MHPNSILRDARLASGLTQVAAASKLGISTSCLANIEADTSRRPSFETLARMIEVYKLDPRLLFSEDWKSGTKGDDEIARALRSLTGKSDEWWAILNAISRLGIEGAGPKLLEAARILRVIFIPVE